jgi:hypothetical protein
MLIFVVSIPLMLCVKPIVLGCCVKHEDHADEFKQSDNIEMGNMNE